MNTRRFSGRHAALIGLAALALFQSAQTALAGRWHDDFNQAGLNDWAIFNLDRVVESWRQQDGVVVGQIFEPDFLTLLLLEPRDEKPDTWTNYSVRVKVRLTSSPRDDDETRFGLSLYDQGFDENRYLCLLAYQAGELQLIRATAGLWQAIPAPFPVEDDRWYDLYAAVETLAGTEQLTFRIDDNPGITISSTGPLASGGVGLVVADGEVEFDDFEVIGANIPNGGRGLPRAVTAVGRTATTWARLKGD